MFANKTDPWGVSLYHYMCLPANQIHVDLWHHYHQTMSLSMSSTHLYWLGASLHWLEESACKLDPCWLATSLPPDDVHVYVQRRPVLTWGMSVLTRNVCLQTKWILTCDIVSPDDVHVYVQHRPVLTSGMSVLTRRVCLQTRSMLTCDIITTRRCPCLCAKKTRAD